MGRKLVLCGTVALALAVVGCTALERADIQADAAAYLGAPVDAQAVEVVGRAVDVALQKSGNPVELAIWALGGAVAIGGGYIKRKFIAKKYADVKAAIKTAVAKTDTGPSPEDKE